MSLEKGKITPPFDGKFVNYEPQVEEVFTSLLFYLLTDVNGEFPSIPADQKLIVDGIRAAANEIPQLNCLIDTRGELVAEARAKLTKLQEGEVVAEAGGRYQLSDKQKKNNTFGSSATILFTAEGIELFRGAVQTAQSVWFPQSKS